MPAPQRQRRPGHTSAKTMPPSRPIGCGRVLVVWLVWLQGQRALRLALNAVPAGDCPQIRAALAPGPVMGRSGRMGGWRQGQRKAVVSKLLDPRLCCKARIGCGRAARPAVVVLALSIMLVPDGHLCFYCGNLNNRISHYGRDLRLPALRTENRV